MSASITRVLWAVHVSLAGSGVQMHEDSARAAGVLQGSIIGRDKSCKRVWRRQETRVQGSFNFSGVVRQGAAELAFRDSLASESVWICWSFLQKTSRQAAVHSRPHLISDREGVLGSGVAG